MLAFELKVQAALGIFYLSALILLALTARKRISLSADSDQMALPSGHPQAFREKGLTQTLYLDLICADFFIGFSHINFYPKQDPHRCFGTDLVWKIE